MRVIFYGYAIWPITLKKEHKLRVFRNRMPRKMLEPKRDKIKDGEIDIIKQTTQEFDVILTVHRR